MSSTYVLNNSLLFCSNTKLFTASDNLIKLYFIIFVLEVKFLNPIHCTGHKSLVYIKAKLLSYERKQIFFF